MFNPENGFTSDVIKSPDRFVGRTNLVMSCLRVLNSEHSLIVIYGKRGVGKSSLLRQIQQIATGDFTLPKKMSLQYLISEKQRKYLTVYYQCDSLIDGCDELLLRLVNDQDGEDGLLRLVPDDGKELVEFSRAKSVNAGADLKIVKWGTQGVETSRYARTVPGDVVQTFRNFLNSIITHQLNKYGKDGILILIDEFDVIKNKHGIGSLIKSLTSDKIKFAICGIADDVSSLVEDHHSVERLLEEGSMPVLQMPHSECLQILNRAEELFDNEIKFVGEAKEKISQLSSGYPYLVQLFGKACIHELNKYGKSEVDEFVLNAVLNAIKKGEAFPSLETKYQRAIGNSEQRQLLLHLLSEEEDNREQQDLEMGLVYLKNVRKEAVGLEIENMDQIIPRLVDKKYGPVLSKIRKGVYEFVDPVFRIYVNLREL
ncbi:MAG: hypothetical protein CL920_13465 [Deltaproteobacteria bacterium]|nr:hypothetical protein [Deltaproteobacteria bacterium]MBU49699.1 hypothetical protein [Deltaproteobacteria bacterium]|tara:strand:+ start:3974 stop:5257 length:1284 start_codon:yes stop_codon:yes gene_type:complete